MTLSSAFPIKFVDRTKAGYQEVPWYQFVLIPKRSGSSLKEFVEAAEDLRSALEKNNCQIPSLIFRPRVEN